MVDLKFINSLKVYREEYNRNRVEFAAEQFLSRLFRQFEAKTIEYEPKYIIYVINNQTYVEYEKKNPGVYFIVMKIYI